MGEGLSAVPTRGRWPRPPWATLLEQPGLRSALRRAAVHTAYDKAINGCFVKYWN